MLSAPDLLSFSELSLTPSRKASTASSISEIASLCTTQAQSATVTAGTYEIQLGLIAQRRLGMERAQ